MFPAQIRFRPLACLSRFSMCRQSVHIWLSLLVCMQPRAGIEPATCRLRLDNQRKINNSALDTAVVLDSQSLRASDHPRHPAWAALATSSDASMQGLAQDRAERLPSRPFSWEIG